MNKKTLKEYLELLAAGGFFDKQGACVGLLNRERCLFAQVFLPSVRFFAEEMGGCVVDQLKIYDDAKIFLTLESVPYDRNKKFLCF